ncbi:CGG triplet repeat-binding 1 [Paramuricea clavata]|uniref:CGG triplet repeat-binding 1 n=1 Tax=Paramuricea clavata TaxID=317549 RepID=A0A6S7FRM1_PARCT|nr:CGG triplet repeat-binding 1 [Paramuricea clavata]
MAEASEQIQQQVPQIETTATVSVNVQTLEIDEQDVLERQFESAFKQAEAKLLLYIVDGGQPASEFLKEVRVLDPCNIVSSSKRHSSYSNIPGFKDTVTSEEWQKYVNILGPDAVSESENGKVDLTLFWKSNNAAELPELYKFASCYCTGTLGSYDVERSFSSYNSILDSKRRNLNEQTLKAIHFLNWNLRVKNSITDESTTPKPVHEVTKKSSCHLSTKLPKPGPQPIIATKQDQEGRC